MAKTITIDNAVVTQVRVMTDATGNVHLLCDYALYSGTTLIEVLSGDVTQLLGSADQSSALSVFNSVMQAIASSQGVTVTGPNSATVNGPTAPVRTSPSAPAARTHP